MQAKRYLNQIRIAGSRLRIFRAKIMELKAMSVGIGSLDPEQERVKTSSQGFDFTNISAKLMDKEKRYKKDLSHYLIVVDEAASLILELENELYIDILRLRYFENYTWREISIKLAYSERHILRVHGEALKAFDEILNEKVRGNGRCQ